MKPLAFWRLPTRTHRGNTALTAWSKICRNFKRLSAARWDSRWSANPPAGSGDLELSRGHFARCANAFEPFEHGLISPKTRPLSRQKSKVPTLIGDMQAHVRVDV